MSQRPCDPKQKPLTELRPSRAELDILRQKTTDLVVEKPEKAAIILTEWLEQSAPRHMPRKKTG